jgi:two-component system, sensor histidine kinase and response regulator
LVVEDNVLNQEVARVMLENLGVRVLVVGDGQQAVELLCNQGLQPDLVFMDIQMPVMDGYDATRRIRESLGAASPPIVAMTAHAFAEDARHCFEVGMLAHIGKPLDPEDLAMLLAQFLITPPGADDLPGGGAEAPVPGCPRPPASHR